MYQAFRGLVLGLWFVGSGCSSGSDRFESDKSQPGTVLDASNDAPGAKLPDDGGVMGSGTTAVPTEATHGRNPDAAESPTQQPVAASTADAASGSDDQNTNTGESHAQGLDAGQADGRGACHNRPGAFRGTSEQSVSADGETRTFIYHAPADLDPNEPAPLVIVPHGFTMSGQTMFDITRYHEIADREGFVVAYPDGGSGRGPWNVGSGVCGAGELAAGTNDDQEFLDAILEFVDGDRCLDRKHIFVSGFSMGGYFSNEVGCLRSDIAAIGPHSGGTHDLSSCASSLKPVIVFHFREDSLIDYDCGVESAHRWAERNGCELETPNVQPLQGGACEYFRGCSKGAQVALCSFDIPSEGAGTLLSGHGWAGGESSSFSVVGTASASEVGWQFFKDYAW